MHLGLARLRVDPTGGYLSHWAVDTERTFAAALRILIGNHAPRFRSKSHVEAFVRKIGVPSVADVLPPVFSYFMVAVLHVFNCTMRLDPTEQR
jgi:hypothetical protein